MSETLPALFIHPMKVMKHLNINGCLSLQHRISFHVRREYPKSSVLCAISESTLAEIAQCDLDKWLIDALRSSSHPPYTTKERYETFQQQWVSFLGAQYLISCTERLLPNLTFYAQFESQPWMRLHCMTHEWLRDAFRSSSHLGYTSK